jgi:ubiquinone/menaquinone biosynthesis C-methylase UbiE
VQSQESVDSFGWQWTEQTVVDSLRTFHRRLFKDCGIWTSYLDGKVVADVCSGNGRHVWAISRLANPSKLISVELAEKAVALQCEFFSDIDNVEVLHGDAMDVKFQADFIYMLGAIQHVSKPEATLHNIIGCLYDKGELVVSFYLKTPATLMLEPLRAITKRLPKRFLWLVAPLLAPIFMVKKAGREMGFINARHTAYDWFGSHQYQRYFTEDEVLDLFDKCGIHETNIIRLQKGLYKVRRGAGANIDDVIHAFGAGV